MTFDKLLICRGQSQVTKLLTTSKSLKDVGNVELVVVPLEAVLVAILAGRGQVFHHIFLFHSDDGKDRAAFFIDQQRCAFVAKIRRPSNRCLLISSLLHCVLLAAFLLSEERVGY